MDLKESFDAVVFLARPGEAPYAARFARELPVFVVRRDANESVFHFETSNTPGIEWLTIPELPPLETTRILSEALRSREVRSPLLWASDSSYDGFFTGCASRLKVFQATEEREPVPVAADLVLPKKIGFDEARNEILKKLATGPTPSARSLNVLYLYCGHSVFIPTVDEYLRAFPEYSRHQYHFSYGVIDADPAIDFELFDVIVLHYSVRLSLKQYVSPHVTKKLQRFAGLKCLFIQDEYEGTDNARSWIERLGFQIVFTVVPEPYVENVYPKARFPHVRFISVLTGYVPLWLEKLPAPAPLAERTTLLGYRGRPLHYWYGDLGRDKLLIGVKMRAACEERGVPVDIEWEEGKRIYGDGWYVFLSSCRAMLGSESGSNVFDEDGTLRQAIDAELKANPNFSYDECRERFLKDREGKVARMNQVSPRLFETVACRTALVLFEGDYSGVVRPDVHYIPLKKDFSNVDEVLAKLADVEALQAMVDRAYADVIGSGKYSYRAFVELVDQTISAAMRYGRGTRFYTTLAAYHVPGEARWRFAPSPNRLADTVSALPIDQADATPLVRNPEALPPPPPPTFPPPELPKGPRGAYRKIWLLSPPLVRKGLHPFANLARAVIRKTFSLNPLS